MSTQPADPAAVDAARLLLATMGLDPTDLLPHTPGTTTAPTPSAGAAPVAREMPTVREWIPVVAGLVSAGTARAYGSYWRKADTIWGERSLDQITATEIKATARNVRATALVRRNSRGGRHAEENFIAAIRCLYRHAEDDGLLPEHRNPARRVTKPRRHPSTRRALPDERIAELNDTLTTTGDDPELDALLLRLHEETACRRGGALALRPRDLDPQQCLILLREKGDTVRWQPVSPTLMRHLLAHATDRGTGHPDDQLLRYRDGRPITRRRYDYLCRRAREHLPWAARMQVSVHWLRHTTLTWVERHYGYAIAHAYAGHTTSHDTTATYLTVDLSEIATALATLTGEPHPLATPPTPT